MATDKPIVLRFDGASFAYNDGKKVILDEAVCTLREGTKITIMGQNGAGKSTMFKLIMGEEKLQEGKIVLSGGKTIAIAKQVIPREQMKLTMREFFETAFEEKDYQLDKKIAEVLKEVQLDLPTDKHLYDLSGGQQARLLLAFALIQKPDILLLDEPTNNLDSAGIGNLIGLLMTYDKTVVVISHDADFLNIPEPIIEPITIVTAVNSPNFRIKECFCSIFYALILTPQNTNV